MGKIDDAGRKPAFPTTGPFEPNLKNSSFTYPGITIRDWFAGQAMAGQLSAMNPGFFDKPSAEQLALSAYWIADAMLAVRSNRSEP